MKPLRVALVSPRFLPQLGGVETHVLALATSLTAAGHDVTVLTQGSRALVAAEGRSTRHPAGFLIRRFVRVAAMEDIPAPGIFAHLIARSGRYDVVHAHNYHALPALAAALSPSRTPLVLTPHYHGEGSTDARSLLHHVYRPLGRVMVSRSKALVAVAAPEAELLREHFPSAAGRLSVIPNGIDVAVAPPVPVSEPYVLSVGRLEVYKRVDLLVRAFLDSDLPGRLVVAGDGPARADLERLAAGSSRVEFLGRVSDEHLASLWAGASGFASLSTEEAFGLGFAEALKRGLPGVASALPAHEAVRDLAGPGPWSRLVPVPGNVPSETDDVTLSVLRPVLAEVFTSPASAPGAGIPSWDAVASGVADVYRAVLEGRPALVA